MKELLAKITDKSTSDAALAAIEERCRIAPDDPEVRLNLASAYDMLDREADAEGVYASVRALGLHALSTEDRARWYAQYGSTLRLLGKYRESIAVLEEGVAAVPGDAAMHAFLALTQAAAGKNNFALASALTALLHSGDASVDRYKSTLSDYISRLSVDADNG